jgi:hypothetical protein
MKRDAEPIYSVRFMNNDICETSKVNYRFLQNFICNILYHFFKNLLKRIVLDLIRISGSEGQRLTD